MVFYFRRALHTFFMKGNSKSTISADLPVMEEKIEVICYTTDGVCLNCEGQCMYIPVDAPAVEHKITMSIEDYRELLKKAHPERN